MFGYVMINGENDYTVNVDLEEYGTGYNVVSKDIDPYNQYDLDAVRAYIEANPEKVLTAHPLEAKFALSLERSTLQNYLNKTDYMVVKCMERGLSMQEEYPDEYIKRQQARERISEINALLEEKN